MDIMRTTMLFCILVGNMGLGGCNSSITTASHFADSSTAMASNVDNTTGNLITTSAKIGSNNDTKTQNQQRVPVVSANGSAYFIGVQDEIEVTVFRVPDLSKTVQVSDTGMINLPLVGKIEAAGKTARQVEQALTAKLGAKYLQNPQVNVFVKGFNSQKVTVSGAVKKPGVFAIRGKTTLVSLVAMAGGFHEGSDSSVVVVRTRNGKQEAARFNVSAIESGKIKDPVMMAGDRIVAGHSFIKSTFNSILKALPIVGKFALL